NKEKLKKINSKKYDDVVYELQITKKTGKKINDKIKGEFTLSVFSRMIQEWFDLEPLHLYEFKIGDCKYGPECDEWEEIFDFLDSYKLGAAISAANLKKGDQFKFLYDFGDKISFKIKIINVEE
ncbi:MAG: IS1096 element passenger TnpR family protein, partial [Minisyncoccales bacterium]